MQIRMIYEDNLILKQTASKKTATKIHNEVYPLRPIPWSLFLIPYSLFPIPYIASCSDRVRVCLRHRGGACRCLCRISKPCSRRTRLSSSNRGCGMAQSDFPTHPRSRLCRYCLGEPTVFEPKAIKNRYGCWCKLIYYRRKGLRQLINQLGRCSSGRALCLHIRRGSLRN